MGEARDSSVLFSLNQLMGMEQDRLQEEERARQKKLEAEATQRALEEQRRLSEERSRMAAESERRRQEESRRREEEARLEALRQATVERARIEAEQRARIEAMTLAQEHERRLATLAEDASKKKMMRAVIIASVLTFTVVAGSLGFYFGKLVPEADQAKAEQAAVIAQKEAEREALARDLQHEAERVRQAERDLAQARDAAATAKATAALEDAKRAEEATKKRLNQGTTQVVQPKKTVCDCDPRDPACGCLP